MKQYFYSLICVFLLLFVFYNGFCKRASRRGMQNEPKNIKEQYNEKKEASLPDTLQITTMNTITFDKSFFEKFSNNLIGTVIIGSGPAGCGAALYSARLGNALKNKGITVVISGAVPGGQLTGTGKVENWPGVHEEIDGKSLMCNARTQAERFGAFFIDGTVEKISIDEYPFKVVLNNGKIFYALSIIIASGSNPKELGCPGERAYWGKGVSSCAICDAPLYKGSENVAVVGGGNSAGEEALQLAEYAKKVHLFVRGSSMRADAIIKEKIAEKENITIWYNTIIEEIKGNEEGVTEVTIKSGENDPIDFAVSGVFIAIGHHPNTLFIPTALMMNEQKEIICDERTQKTNIEGIFAAGDVVAGAIKQAGTAYADGIRAAIESYEFLQKKGMKNECVGWYPDAWFLPEGSERTIACVSETTKSIDEVNQLTHEKEMQEKKAALFVKQYEKKINEIYHSDSWEDIFSQIAEQELWCVVDLYTTYCPACVRLKKMITQLIEKKRELPLLFSINVSEEKNTAVAAKFRVRAVPLLLLFHGNREVARHVGYMSEEEFLQWVAQYKK